MEAEIRRCSQVEREGVGNVTRLLALRVAGVVVVKP
jgi:hypothetical protein